ncbi:hypothetical protein IC575_021180 [Cucumis melo]
MALQLSLQLFLLIASVAPHVITARVRHTHIPSHLKGSRIGNNIEGIYSVKLYLKRYGYLITNVPNTDSNDTFDVLLESAIKTFQKYHSLNVSGVLDKETLTLMSLPRCGISDIVHNNNVMDNNIQMNSSSFHSHYTFLPGNPKWPISKYNLKYTFLEGFPNDFKEPVMNAMDQWALFSLFRFSETIGGEEVDITFNFVRGNHGDGHPFDGKGGVLAHAFGPLDGRVHFDWDEDWADGSVGGFINVGMVALHELGHVLGLAHSTIRDAIMWPYMHVGEQTRGLQFDDIEGIQTLYAP